MSLSFVPPVETFEIDLPKKLVWIESDKDSEVLMEALKKSGKEVKYNGTKWRNVHVRSRWEQTSSESNQKKWMFMLLDPGSSSHQSAQKAKRIKKLRSNSPKWKVWKAKSQQWFLLIWLPVSGQQQRRQDSAAFIDSLILKWKNTRTPINTLFCTVCFNIPNYPENQLQTRLSSRKHHFCSFLFW